MTYQTIKPRDKADRSKLVYDSHREELGFEATATRSKTLEKFRALRVAFFDQMSIRHQIDAFSFGLVASAVARLPNLTEITLSFKDGVVQHTTAFKRAYAETMYPPEGDDGHRDPYGVMQLGSVLYGVSSTETKIKSLDCGRIDWKILSINEKRMSVIKRALKHLENFRIMFYVGKGYLAEADYHRELSRCAIFLSNYSMSEFLSSAKELRTLSLYIDESGGGCDLRYMVGTTTWAYLRVIELDSIYAPEETLIEFLKRHAGTLRELGLNNITLISGCWTSALPEIRSAVRLNELRAVGFWSTYRPFKRWIINTSLDSQEPQESTLSQPCKLGVAVNKYLLEGGNCPLLDPVTYPYEL